MKQYFYGIRGIEFIWHGEWSDPELIWHGKSFKKNAYLAREYLQNLLDNKCFYGGQLVPF